MRAKLEALKRSIEEAKAAPAYAPMAKARAAERAVEQAAELLDLIVSELEGMKERAQP